MLGEVKDYIWLLGGTFLIWVGGIATIVPFIEWAIKKYKKKSIDIQTRSLWWVGGICFLIASFMAWRDERAVAKDMEGRLKTSEERFEKATRAQPRIIIHEVGISSDPIGMGQPFSIVLIVSIRNVGAPSVFGGYNLRALLPDGRTITCRRHFLDKEEVIVGVPQDFVYGPQDALYEKTLRPIPQGGYEIGLLKFSVPQIPEEVIFQVGTKLELCITDVSDNRHCTFWTSDGKVRFDSESFPGLSPEKRRHKGKP